MARMLCTVCGEPPRTAYVASLHGEVTCTTHVAADDCVLCARPMPTPGLPDWRQFTRNTVRCPTCVASAIETQQQARTMIPVVRDQMADIGIRLSTRVRVSLADPGDLDMKLPRLSPALGITVRSDTEVLGIEIARGLPPVHFGKILAHEIGHAWFFDRGGPQPDPMIEEGTCELFSSAWLKRQRTSMAELLRQSMMNNPDPVYGEGYRLVRRSVMEHGIRAVLDRLLVSGRLP